MNYTIESDIRNFIEGVSGGVDSTVVCDIGLIARDRLRALSRPIDIYYVFLDVESHPDDYKRAQEFAALRKFPLHYHDLTNLYQYSLKFYNIPDGHPFEKIEKGNIKCRTRMMFLMDRAKRYRGVYLDTDDLSEFYMGFWTRHGDEGDVKLIQELTKDEVYDLAEYLHAPNSILITKPGDGLGVTANSLASDQLGMSYLKIDYVMSRFIQFGLDTNGSVDQLLEVKYLEFAISVAKEIDENWEMVTSVVKQCLKTAFKRRYGENVANLLPSRLEMGLYRIGTNRFNELYLAAIKKENENR